MERKYDTSIEFSNTKSVATEVAEILRQAQNSPCALWLIFDLSLFIQKCDKIDFIIESLSDKILLDRTAISPAVKLLEES